jgi:hypothetical protein
MRTIKNSVKISTLFWPLGTEVFGDRTEVGCRVLRKNLTDASVLSTLSSVTDRTEEKDRGKEGTAASRKGEVLGAQPAMAVLIDI